MSETAKQIVEAWRKEYKTDTMFAEMRVEDALIEFNLPQVVEDFHKVYSIYWLSRIFYENLHSHPKEYNPDLPSQPIENIHLKEHQATSQASEFYSLMKKIRPYMKELRNKAKNDMENENVDVKLLLTKDL